MVVGHRSFNHTFDGGAQGSFVWAPYSVNVTDALESWRRAVLAPNSTAAAEALDWSLRGPPGRVVPDALVLCSSLWHMLYFGDPETYGERVAALKAAVIALQDAVAAAATAGDAAGASGSGGAGGGSTGGAGGGEAEAAREGRANRRAQGIDPLVDRRPTVYWCGHLDADSHLEAPLLRPTVPARTRHY